MTRFMQKTFSVPVGSSQAARDGWERTFGKGKRSKAGPLLERFQVQWSDEDRVYIASYDGLPGLQCHGGTPQAALQELMSIAPELIEEDK